VNLVIFAFGVLTFLITIYGTVVVGGLLLTARQIDQQPLLRAGNAGLVRPAAAVDRARSLVHAEY
jgi:hypothetical protein